MKHWIGVICVGAAFAVAGLLSAPEESAGSTQAVGAEASSGLLGLGAIIVLIGLVGVARELMRDRQLD